MDSASIVFDRYRLEERIGAGGMGVVWKACAVPKLATCGDLVFR